MPIEVIAADPMEIDPTTYYRLERYVELTGLSQARVEHLCRTKKVLAKKIRDRWHVAGSEFLVYSVSPEDQAKADAKVQARPVASRSTSSATMPRQRRRESKPRLTA